MHPDWNERYRDEDYAYGQQPNAFYKEQLEQLPPGTMLMPADGEGRNGVFAATLGWNVTAFDLSVEGKAKAMLLARQQQVQLEYVVGDFSGLTFENNSFDAIGLIYAHFGGANNYAYYTRLSSYLKPGGVVVVEVFSKNHLALRKRDPRVGGPMDPDDLFSVAAIQTIFQGYEVLYLKEEVCFLSEGKYHNGESSVIRFVGRKRS